MSTYNKTILRGLIIISYITIISFVTYGVSEVLSYLNTGADRSKMLRTSVQKNSPYTPDLVWNTSPNKGRKTDTQILKAVKRDYLNAWYIKQICYKTNTLAGINDYYTKNARTNIVNTVNYNTSKNITIESTTLNHNPKVEFFSEDGQVVILTDSNVVEYKRIFNDKKLVDEINETSTYRVTLLLEDGFWRIRHLVRITSGFYNPTETPQPMDFFVKGINYYPKASPWRLFDSSFNKKIIKKDFKIIRKAGLNSIRIFIPYDTFGKANVQTDKLEHLITLLDIAKQQKLKVMITLFDFYGSYEVLNWTQTQKHAKTIVNAVKTHEALLGWDVKNEPNLDFDSRGKALVIAWLDKMIGCIKTYDKTHPVTIGWSDIESATILHDKLDVITFHYYDNLDSLGEKYKALQTKVKQKPIVLTEYGASSYIGFWRPFGNTEQDQAEYHKKIQTIFAKNNIMFMSWTLYDFKTIPTAVVGALPWRKALQQYYGFIDVDGNKKPAFKYISSSQ